MTTTKKRMGSTIGELNILESFMQRSPLRHWAGALPYSRAGREYLSGVHRGGIPEAVHLRINTAGLKYVLLVPASKKAGSLPKHRQ